MLEYLYAHGNTCHANFYKINYKAVWFLKGVVYITNRRRSQSERTNELCNVNTPVELKQFDQNAFVLDI
jgi:hypothetical protein